MCIYIFFFFLQLTKFNLLCLVVSEVKKEPALPELCAAQWLSLVVVGALGTQPSWLWLFAVISGIC